MRAGTCKHFTGTAHNTRCRIGIRYDSVTPDPKAPGCALRLPCHQVCHFTSESQLREFERRGTCKDYQEPTPEEIAAHTREIDLAMARMIKTIPLVERVKREHNGENWKGVEECPVCKGRLHLSHAASNGHVWGKCETKDCLAWME